MEVIQNIFPFLLCIGFSLFFAGIDVGGLKLPPGQYKVSLFVLLFTLIIFCGFRWSSGFHTDYEVYSMVYENPVDIFNFSEEYIYFTAYITKIDVGYVFLSSLFAGYISSNPNFFFTILALVTLVLFYKSLRRNGIHAYLFLILFIFVARLYFQYPFTMIRQAFVMSVLWYSLPLVYARRFWPFATICLLCATLHFSALFFLIVYWLPKVNLSNRTIIVLLVILFIIGIANITDKLMLSIAEAGLSLIGMSGRLAGYLFSDTYNRGINPLNFLEVVPFVYWALKYRDGMTRTIEGKLFFNMLIFYVVFLLITMNFMALTRISSYFIFSYFYVLYYAFLQFRNPINRTVVGYLIIAYFLLYAVRYILMNFSYVVYEPFFLHL